MLRALLAVTVALLANLMAQLAPAAAQTADRGRLYRMVTVDVPAGATSLKIDLADQPGRVRALRVVAVDGAAIINRMMVTYTNGSIHYEDREKPINLLPGERTAEIDPRDIGNWVDRIELMMDPVGKPMRLEIWALQTAADRSARRATPPLPDVAAAPPPTERSAEPPGERPKSAKKKSAKRSIQPPTRSLAPEPGKPYAAVDIFYATNRKPEAPRTSDGRTLATYGNTPDAPLTLGLATVSVPTEGRSEGEVNRPEWDLIVTSFSLRGQDPARDFTLLAVDQMSRADFVAKARAHLDKSQTFKGQAFVFVHGYNVSFDYALFRAAQIAFDTRFDGLPFVFSWPSMGGVRGYFLDQRRARASGEVMREFLELVATETGAEKVHLIAHSMGANPILEALQNYAASAARTPPPRFSEVILAAPDVLRDDFERIANRIKGVARGITLFASSNDRALQISSFTTLGVIPAGYVPSNAPPVIVDGVDTIDVSALNTSMFGLNHSTFADRQPLIDDIKALILDVARRRPNERQPKYTPIPVTPAQTFWRYVQ